MIKFTLTSEDVRQACISNQWFTLGTTNEYQTMLDNVEFFGTDMAEFQAEDLIHDTALTILRWSDADSMMEQSGCTWEEIRDNVKHVLLSACKLSF